MAVSDKSVQQQFISRINEMLPSNISLVDEIEDLLGISKDSAYRRMRCETPFSIDETIALCNHFGISLDSFIKEDSGSVSFNYKNIGSTQEDFVNYLKSILEDLKKIKSSANAHIYYSAEDVPLFHNFIVPEIARFKIFYWLKSVLNVPEFSKQKYSPELLSGEYDKLGKDILNLYVSIPSTEIWTDSTVNSLLKQIIYYCETGMFKSKAEALNMCDKALELYSSIEKQAEYNSKFVSEAAKHNNENNFKLYQSDVEVGNNCILVKTVNNNTVYLTHSTFNNMQTTNCKFCEEMEIWFTNLIKKSVLISGVSEKHRYKYFQNIYNEIQKIKERVELNSNLFND
ncbi:MAG: hypothetical protein PHD97_06005 [Bacteroidales bacterium]|nr:hypothetical protein [Bacteroidales bacterium]